MFPSGEGREYIYAPDNQTFWCDKV
jgi:hypothetical protein